MQSEKKNVLRKWAEDQWNVTGYQRHDKKYS